MSVWSTRLATIEWNREVDSIHDRFFGINAEWSGRHYGALLDAATLIASKGPPELAIKWFDAAVRDVERMGAPSERDFPLEPLIAEIWDGLCADLALRPTGSDTGLPGAPTKGKEAIDAELDRMLSGNMDAFKKADGNVGVIKLATHLVQWYVANHPGRSAPTALTTKNNISAKVRRYNLGLRAH